MDNEPLNSIVNETITNIDKHDDSNEKKSLKDQFAADVMGADNTFRDLDDQVLQDALDEPHPTMVNMEEMVSRNYEKLSSDVDDLYARLAILKDLDNRVDDKEIFKKIEPTDNVLDFVKLKLRERDTASFVSYLTKIYSRSTRYQKDLLARDIPNLIEKMIENFEKNISFYVKLTKLFLKNGVYNKEDHYLLHAINEGRTTFNKSDAEKIINTFIGRDISPSQRAQKYKSGLITRMFTGKDVPPVRNHNISGGMNRYNGYDVNDIFPIVRHAPIINIGQDG